MMKKNFLPTENDINNLVALIIKQKKLVYLEKSKWK